MKHPGCYFHAENNAWALDFPSAIISKRLGSSNNFTLPFQPAPFKISSNPHQSTTKKITSSKQHHKRSPSPTSVIDTPSSTPNLSPTFTKLTMDAKLPQNTSPYSNEHVIYSSNNITVPAQYSRLISSDVTTSGLSRFLTAPISLHLQIYLVL